MRWVQQRYSAFLDEVFARERSDFRKPHVVTVQLRDEHPPAFLLTVHVLPDGNVEGTVAEPTPCSLLLQMIALRSAGFDSNTIVSRIESKRRPLTSRERSALRKLVRRLERMKVRPWLRDAIWDFTHTREIRMTTTVEQMSFTFQGPSDHPLMQWAESVRQALELKATE